MLRNEFLLLESTPSGRVAKNVDYEPPENHDALINYDDNSGSSRTAQFLRADAAEFILDKIKEPQSSLLAAGAFSTSNWRRSLFGSVSEYLIRYCTAPLFSRQ